MHLVDGIPVWGDPIEANSLKQIQRCARTADRAALMADHHKGYAVPIGGVVAYADNISPSGVGYDIACGNKAVLTDAKGADVRKNISRIMDDVFENLTFGIGQKNRVRVDHELFDDETWKLAAVRPLKDLARDQLGTVGGGNHYVDILVDEQDRVWIGVHFGSRGLGFKTATWFLEKGGAKDGMDVDPLVIPANSALGADYLACMHLAGRYAYAGRDWVCAETARLLGWKILEEVHNHHNFAWRETHGGEKLWVVRKGATPAFPGQKGFIGGSMGDISAIVEGIANDQAKWSLYSTVHGAGRTMGRMEAKGKYVIKVCDGTACHVRKSHAIIKTLQRELGLSGKKKTTDDMLFTLETVACLGTCGLAPVVVVNDEVHGAMTAEKTTALLTKLKAKEDNHA